MRGKEGTARPLRFLEMMIRKLIIAALILSAGLFLAPPESPAQPDCRWRERRLYGGYCRGPRGGWYGARNPVKTAEEARSLLKQYFEGQDVVIGKITARKWFFEAEIRDKKDTLIDRVIVDKRTGRIRSIY